MVESVKGMPNFSAARAALISPSAVCMPAAPVGERPSGIVAGRPRMVVARLRLVMSTPIRCCRRMR